MPATARTAPLSAGRLMARMLGPRHLPAGRVKVLPGVLVPAPIGPLADLDAGLSLGRIGSLEVRLARTVGEVKRAQALRYRVFYEEMGAIADARALMTRRDADAFDAICDHLLVVDHDAQATNAFGRKVAPIVGTYRLLRQEIADRHDGFYTAGEFEIGALIARHPAKRFLELGRSCVLQPYRNKRTVELLWHGIWAYVLRHRIDVMFGCASLEGTDPHRLAMPLAFLHHNALATGAWQVRALPDRHVGMDRMAREAIDDRVALRVLPPLVKGYLRLGAMIGDGAVVDHQFGTTDICIVLPVEKLNPRYVDYYGADASRHAG